MALTYQKKDMMFCSPSVNDYKLKLRFGPWSEPLKELLNTMNENDYIMLLVYNDDNGNPDNTSITVTGGIEENEKIENALKREIHEEMGINEDNRIYIEQAVEYDYVIKKHKASKTIYLHKQRFPSSGFIAKKPTNIDNTPRLDHTKKVGSIMYSSNIKDFEWFLRSWDNDVPFSQKEKNGHRGYTIVQAYKLKKYLKLI